MFRKRWFFPVVVSLVIVIILVTTIGLIYKLTATTFTGTTCSAAQATATANSTPAPYACLKRLLVFSKTAAFRHASIADGKVALQQLATEHGFSIDFTEDASVFTSANLVRYSAVIFLMTTGEVFDNDQEQVAFQRYIEAGGGYVGIHSASDTEYDWPWYGSLVGSFNNVTDKHSSILQTTVHVEDPNTPSTSMLPRDWVRTDEWYNFAIDPRANVHVLLTIDERTYKGGTMGADHPIAWYHQYDGGRAWYTSMGHTSESYHEPLFLAHIWGGIVYAVGP
ncbi:MAG TPA: ThuA domain-containing protein [Ktedonobacteraceae bacterium]|nr:ThuA domain-containing protein [Ktedonobacteraceae bacterium]